MLSATLSSDTCL